LTTKADALDLKELINRQNNLESYVHQILNERGKSEQDLTRAMLERDEENKRAEEERLRRSIKS